MNWIRGTFWAVLTVCAIVLTIDLHRLMPKASAALDSVQAIETNTTRTEAEMSGLLNETRHIAKDEREAQAKQLARADALGARAETLLITANALAGDADVTMKHLDTSALQLAKIGVTTNDAIAGIAADAHSTLGESQKALQAATADLSDPALKQTIARAGEASENLAIATKEASGAMSDVHKVTDYEAKQIMAPVSKVKAVAYISARLIGRFFGF
jgi:uncharacterized protein YoxC